MNLGQKGSGQTSSDHAMRACGRFSRTGSIKYGTLADGPRVTNAQTRELNSAALLDAPLQAMNFLNRFKRPKHLIHKQCRSPIIHPSIATIKANSIQALCFQRMQVFRHRA